MASSAVVLDIVTTSGDRAEADSPEAAILAARTLLRDARHADRVTRTASASIYTNGVLVASGLTARDLGA